MSTSITSFDFEAWLERLALPASAGQTEQLTQYAALLREVNTRINLVSRKDIEQLEVNHILHALLGAHFFSVPAGFRVLDVGTGGGIPGIVLAILYPEATFTLLDSTQKKIQAVKDMAEALLLKNIRCTWERVEEHRPRYDAITGRAVSALPDFWNRVRLRLDKASKDKPKSGVWYWKGGDLKDEIANLSPDVQTKTYDLGEIVTEWPYYETKYLLYLKIR